MGFNSDFEDIDPDINHLNEIYPDYNVGNTSEYYDISKFNHDYKHNQRNLTLYHLNVCSLLPKCDEVQTELSLLECQFDVLCFTESWLTEQNKHLVSFNGFNSFHNLRVDRRGGGVSFFVSDRFKVNVLSQLNMSNVNCESLFLELVMGNIKLVCAGVYRPPSGDQNMFIENLMQSLTAIDRNLYRDIFVMGDFNFNLLEHEYDSNVQTFLSSMFSLSFLPTISKPTRITDHTATLLDNIFLTVPEKYSSGCIISSVSDHYPVFIISSVGLPSFNTQYSISYSYRKINTHTLSLFFDSVQSCDFTDILQCDDVNDALSRLDLLLFDRFNVNCPIVHKTTSPKSIIKPWISRDILSEIKRRQNLQILLKSKRISLLSFKRFRNYVTSKIRVARKLYYEAKFEEFKNDSKKTWNLINNIVKPSSRLNKSDIEKIIVDDEEIGDSVKMSSAFNEFFVNIGSDISRTVNCQPHAHKEYLRGNYPNSIYFSPVSSSEVNNLICSLKNKPSHFNCIPARALKCIRGIISPVICNIINRSISSGVFPDSLKIAKVVPIYKHGSRTNIVNYRPISLLPVISKILEKVVHRQIYTYLCKHNILFSDQYGFRNGKSTVNAMVKFMHNLYSSLDSGSLVFSIFLDFKKAFDCVNHEILMSKMHHYGIRGIALEWFNSYLINRKQFVSIQGSNSTKLPITHGVPQGSVLGPLLFLMFINDLPNCTNFFQFILFADDSTLSCDISDANFGNIHNEINNNLGALNRWLICNKIAINTDKTKYMIFSNRNVIHLPPIYIGSGLIQPITSAKFLGIHIDCNLTFSQHINYLCNKLSKNIGILYKMNKILPKHVLLTLYRSLILPYFSYGIEIYFNSAASNINKLVILQKKCIRAINNIGYFDHTLEYFRLDRILSLADLYEYHILCYMYRTLYLNYDSFLLPYLIPFIHQHNYVTRNRFQLIIPRFRTVKAQYSINYVGIKLWNSLPENIKKSKSISAFKRTLREYLIDKIV